MQADTNYSKWYLASSLQGSGIKSLSSGSDVYGDDGLTTNGLESGSARVAWAMGGMGRGAVGFKSLGIPFEDGCSRRNDQ